MRLHMPMLSAPQSHSPTSIRSIVSMQALDRSCHVLALWLWGIRLFYGNAIEGYIPPYLSYREGTGCRIL